jgi:TolA-binding protein
MSSARRSRATLDAILGTALITLVIGAGCVTSGQGDVMRKDIAQLRERIEHMERRGADAEEQMTRLRTVLDEATGLLNRNTADAGQRIQRTEMELGALQGKLEEARHVLEQLQKSQADENARLAALEQGQAKIVDRVAPTMAEDKETLWKQAQERMAGGMREDARRFLRGFVQRFPQDPRAPQALLETGRSYALEGKHTLAVAEYQKVLKDYGKSPEVPEAMWQVADSFIALKFCGDARAFLQDLIRRYPRSQRVPDAKSRLREVQKMSRDKGACTS